MRAIALIVATLFGLFVLASALIAGVHVSVPTALFLVWAPAIVWWLAKPFGRGKDPGARPEDPDG